MKQYNYFILCGLLFLLQSASSYAVSAQKIDAQKILQKADQARGGVSKGLAWELDLNSQDKNKKTSFKYQVKVKDNNVLAKCIEPPRSKGEVFLFLDRNLWIHRPGLRKPLSLSPRQRLSGQASNGDIATTNYARDYEATLLNEETLNGTKTWKLKLKGKSKDLTYDQINYWVSKDQNLGIKAEFLTLQGQVFKTATIEYKNSITVSGLKIPFISRMLITDAKDPSLTSELIYSNPNSENMSEAIFNVNRLGQ